MRGTLVSFTGDPFLADPEQTLRHETDGLVVCRDGLIEAVGPYPTLRNELPADFLVADYSGCIISAGFIDTHTHYVQTGIIAAPGKRLLDWVSDYVYPVEESFAHEAHARDVASFFCDALLRNGTTTSCVYCAVYPQSVEALFAEAEKRKMRIIAGKCMMDRNVPEALRDTAKTGYDQSKALIERWHGKGAAALCHHATLGRIEHAGTARSRRVVARASKASRAGPYRRDTRRARFHRQAVSGA